MQKITNVVSRSMASMYNIFEVWFVLTLIWSAVGVVMFAQSAETTTTIPRIENNDNNNNQIHFSQHLYGLNDHSNFNDFFHSFLSLLRISTYDHWSELYKGCLELHGGSSSGSSGLHAVYTFLTALYFVSYIIITGPLLKALSVAVLYSQFVRLKSMNESKTMLSTRDKEAFTSVWLQYDPTGSGYIPMSAITPFLLELRRQEFEHLLKLRGKKEDPRIRLMEQLKYQDSARRQEERESMKRFTHRMLVRVLVQRWWLCVTVVAVEQKKQKKNHSPFCEFWRE